MTRLFAPCDGPRIFGLPPGVDFSRALLAGLEARLAGTPPEAMARVEIWVNTQRARRALMALLHRGPARLLPRIRAITELAADPLAPFDLPAPVSDLRRKLELTRLVRRLIAAEPGMTAGTAAFDLADSLAGLMDEMQGEGVAPEAFLRIDAEAHAAHWQRNLQFLGILRDYIASAGFGDGQGRMRAVAEAWAAAWSRDPPPHPVIVAGSTGSRGATRRFMAAVARLPQGALVLPGYDAHMTMPAWERLGPGAPGAADHPQHGFRRLAEALDFDPCTVPFWHDEPAPASARNAVASLALRPAPVTDQWRAEGGCLTDRLAAACDGLTWVEAPDQRAEALAIALSLREAAESGARAALISPDRVLARRVTAELDRWGIIPDDSAGRPLALTPPGVFLRRLAAPSGAALDPESLLVLLKHPLCNSAAEARRAHLRLTAQLETGFLRGGAPHVDWAALRFWAACAGASVWAAWVENTLAPLQGDAAAPLAELVARHRNAAEALAAGPDGGPHALWEKEAGRHALALIEALALYADAGGEMRPAEYRALLQSLLAARDVPEEAVVSDPGIAIWGTLEARVQTADLVILGGLNEGVWPRLPAPDPWLSRAMRAEIGLPSPERQIGLSAHDFQQAMGASRVILTRAQRDAEAPTVASRWLMRIENLVLGLGDEGGEALAAAKTRGNTLLALAARLDRPDAAEPPVRRPEPCPPLAARPAALSVTQIETLVRDPYAIYARKVLGLKALEPLGRQADALTRGSALHAALEAFVAATQGGLPEDAERIFRETLHASLATHAPWPAMRAIWAGHLERAAAWFLEGETERRALAAPRAREIAGYRALDGLARPFGVTAKADRIDRRADGAYAIYDYKSGGVPSAKEAAAFHLQLPLEAAIAMAGGFDGLPAGPVCRLELIGLGAQKVLPIPSDAEAIAETWRRTAALIAHYLDPANGFTARLRPQRLKYQSDYDHLSRKGEWADGDPPAPEPVP